jgi:hypothetical protein
MIDTSRLDTRSGDSTWGISAQVRKAIAKFVLDARGRLEDDFRRQLVALGVQSSRAGDPPAGLAADDEAARLTAELVIERTSKGGVNREEAFAIFVRDSAFTFLNRIVGLRCLEERGLLLVDGAAETAIRRDERLQASSLYFRVRNELPDTTSPRDVWRATLSKAFGAVSLRVGVLFDLESEYGRLVPLQATLLHVVAGLNDPAIPPETWGDDEVLGWIYQYYNSEEKDAVYSRVDKGGKVARPDELAAAACLYTERYMVDFLLQNTLGSLWLEMHPDSRLPQDWHYYVGSPKAKPVHSEGTVPERVRDLSVLDPACGSGHFLARAFDLLAQMYAEEGRETPADVPKLIIGRNLHGIDIDLRAVQISALRLYLKGCQTAGPDFQPDRVNLVSADVILPDAIPPDFIDRFHDDRDVQDLMKAMWFDLKEAPRLGSLIHPERRVDGLLSRRRRMGNTLDYQDDRAWERFKLELLDGIRDQFELESHTADVGRRLFGQNVAKGLSLVEAVTRRYDVVVANPPYTGSNNLADPVKGFLDREYKDGKSGLYAAFIVRCMEFARPGGLVGMVTQQSWMFLRSFAKLRQLVLNSMEVTTLGHLGSRAFEEIGGHVVNVAMFTLVATAPTSGHRLTAFRVIGAKSPTDKDRWLRRAIGGDAPSLVFTPLQADIRSIPETPISLYNLSEAFFRILRMPQFGKSGEVRQGPSPNVTKHVRFFWEVGSRLGWVPYAKGGGYRKWFGSEHWVARWPTFGQDPGSTVRGAKSFFQEGLCYTTVAQGRLGVRMLRAHTMFSDAASGIFSNGAPLSVLAGEWNSHLVTLLARAICGKLDFSEDYLRRLPRPIASAVGPIADCAFSLKAWLTARDPVERTFFERPSQGSAGLASWLSDQAATEEAVAAALHALEGISNSEVCSAYGIGGKDLESVVLETGLPAGWHPIINGYDRLPVLPRGLELGVELEGRLAGLPRSNPDRATLERLKARLRELYLEGPRSPKKTPEDVAFDQDELLVTGPPLPTETFLEQISRTTEVHPVSVAALLEELRQKEALVSLPEAKRRLEDHVSVAILHMLGYRWPENDAFDSEVDPAVGKTHSDLHGVLPLVPCGDQPVAGRLIREHLERLFDTNGGRDSAEEFRAIIGRDIDDWLEREFFERHLQQFSQRPIAWHLSSPHGTFQALVLYQSLSRDTMRRLRDVCAGGLLNRLRGEMERAQARNDAKPAEELRVAMDDVEEFRDRLMAIEEGRGLTSRIRCPWKHEESHGRPGTYAPDLDDGVKVNIRPFQEMGLLAREVIRKW